MYPSTKYAGTKYLLSTVLFLVLINGLVLTESEKDFDFAESESSIKKRSADTLKDDEDLLADEAGSTPDEVDGSGDEPKPPVDLPEFFRITINFTDLEFSRSLEDSNTEGFRTLADQISKAVVTLYDNISGAQTVTVINFEPGSVVATLDLGTQGFYDRTVLYSTLNSAVNSGYIPPYRVSSVGFSFRPLQDGRACPDYAGRDANPLPRSGDNRANLLVNNEFFCRGYVKAWEYYRIVPRYVAYAGVWRLMSDESLILIGKTELPIDTVGNHTVIADPPIMVEKGDFIGIFYPRDAEEGVVASAGQGDVSERELYQNYYATFYDEDVEIGVPFSLERIPYQDISTTFAIRALMDYTGAAGGGKVLPPKTCKPEEFTCNNGECIDGRFKCDGQVDCYDQSDESECTPVTCGVNEHRCKNGQQCIPSNFVCNGQKECFDGSDEAGCPPVACSENQFQCSDGTCIDLDLRCDSRADCPDSSDELACQSKPCRQGEFRCERGQCIDSTLRCDGYPDCGDNTDELDCGGSASCAEEEFRCQTGQCIPQRYYCDGYPDCGDNSDETDCDKDTKCPEGQFKCDDGTCVKPNAGCDGVVDCADRSDESPALCGETISARTQEVIQGSTTILECSAGDNAAITLTWSRVVGGLPSQAVLSNGRLTIPNTTSQDAGRYVCTADTSAVTPVAVDLVVVPASVILSISRSNQVLNVGESAVFDCSATGNANVQLTWTRGSRALGNNAVIQGGRLTIPSVTVEDSDTYICGVTNIAGIAPAQAQLVVIPGCGRDQFKCNDGDCISMAYRCDKFPDCNDGSDEVDCLTPAICPEGQFLCEDKSCVARGSQCNGVRDCADGSDEFPVYCGCGPRQFMCANGRQCIDSMLECNRLADCPDRSDEHSNCTYRCRDNEFRCRDGSCIPLVEECDGTRNCGDGSDEENCPGDRCPVGDFQCDSGNQCVSNSLKCDGFPDCTDGSDERNCRCTADQFRCLDGFCIDKRLRCDRVIHCEDGSDEDGCVTTCAPDEFRCRNGDCIPGNRRCDSRPDCEDASDELKCACGANEFRCSNGDCIPANRQCDRRPDCEDASDELNCGCRGNEFTCRNGDCVPAGRKCDGRYDCEDGSDEQSCGCTDDEFTCNNGDCIPANRKCDNRFDCEDASDEENCVDIGCHGDEFTCLRGLRKCIPSVRQCDGRRDCEDGSDEVGCGCSDNEFTCRSGARRCIPSNRQCDRRRDCEDGSDEENCECRADEFTCGNGDCIPLDRKCDGQIHCRDRSDEVDCGCRDDQFTCAGGSVRCIALDRKCDRRSDCEDGSDENDCGCRDDQFTCAGGSVRCIALERKCDRRSDCEDGSDENDCGCRDNEFTCRSGRRKCIPSNRQCDRRRDCEDGSDELNCGCRDDEFTCGNGDCIPVSRKCDRRIDCRDRSDEQDCGCSAGEFQCNNGDCIPGSFKCNGRPECEDGSDEFDCGCRSGQFQCGNGQCIDERRRCDRRYDCRDGSDEAQCSRPIVVTVTPRVLMLREGRQADFVCTVTGSPSVRLEWSRSGGLALPGQASSDGGRLLIPQLQLEDSGEYICSAVGVRGDYQAVARLEVRRIGPGTTIAPGPCGAGQSVCQNNQCIPSDYRCDGDKDCADGSDELYCTTDNPCEPNEFRCTSGLCVMKIWRCDGDNDCGDGFDESNCPTGRPGDQCRPDEYQCRSGDQCVPASYQCDGEIDCQDRSDEIGCSVPTIILPPVPRIDVEIGGQFTIICEAMGTPVPLIVWRLNWGNIPTGSRIYTSSVGGRGNLTITNAIIEDSGAYTCEAINTKGTIFASPDAIIIVRRTPQGVCNPPLFNVEAALSSECLRCFCFGHTTDCFSSDLHVSEIALVGEMTLVRQDYRRGDVTVQAPIQENPRGTFQIRDFVEVLPSGNYYWNLPAEFTGDRLTSYGGTLTYTILYELAGQVTGTNHADVVLKGNGITLYHRTSVILRPGTEITISVPLLPSAWEKTDAPSGPRGDIPGTEPATREDLMMVLENIDSAYIRANYDVSQLISRIHTVKLSTGVVQETGLGRAVYVEECQCPPGYAGISCQDCATGYRRVRQGPYLGICRRCNCNGHSTDCDPNTGECRFCQHNTGGAQCERCLTSFYGDATLGTSDACRPCPCPLTVAPNQFSPTCVLGGDGQPTCTACPEGYEGRNCERCASGYKGNPRSPGDYCRPITVEDRCDSRGSLQKRPDPITGRCPCKEYVTGNNCDQCKENTFYLAVENPNGCIACFCMGVTDRCTSTSWNRAQVGASFTRDSQGFTLTDITRNPDLTVTEGFTINKNVRELVFRGFSRLPNTVYYWSLPQRFLSDKVVSYGGTLRFVVMYRPGQDSGLTSGPLVELIGNDITLVYRPNRSPVPNTPESYNIRLYEAEWTRLDGRPATREFLMMALADLDAILIRATFTRDTDQASIRDVIMDIAEDRPTNQDRAYTVENCVCPQGYRGQSCEDCDVGFKRTEGLYLGLCERCECNQHSGECDPESGQCRNCQHNTEGDNCERCAAGFYGDATRGSPADCRPCPCPLTETPNQFSPTCILDTDGEVTCTACPAGHTGRRCERCIQGYTGNPLNPGDYCRIGPIEPDCNCDRRGTVPNTQCNPVSKQCQCKSYVQGVRCTNCQEGYFYLSEDNNQGCLSCWCSGITTQCSSSNYYREELRPQLGADGSHNFALTTRRLSNAITDGFTVDIPRNEVRFGEFQGLQREQESLFFSLPPKFRGNRVTSYGGYLRFTLETTVPLDGGRTFRDVDLEFITSGQTQRMYYLFNPPVKMNSPNSYEILLRESSFRMLDGSEPTRGKFLSILSDIEAILIRATYHTITGNTVLRDLRMDSAVSTPTGLPRAPMVESCRCPPGYTGLSCEQCAAGYLRVQEAGRIQCVRCNCNGHATTCDSETGECLNCQHNTAGDRCETCAVGFYGDATVGTTNDCRPCPCPLTIPSNQFSRSCYLAQDNDVTCERCPTGYLGRDCGECDTRRGYFGNPREIGGSCRLETDDLRPVVNVNPKRLEETVGGTVVFQCNVRGNGPFNVVWSRVDRQQLPNRAQTGPRYSLTIRDIVQSDSGRYVCTATNIYGSRQEYVELLVFGRKQPIRVRIEEPREVQVNEGTSVRFVCLASGSREMTYILSWTKQGSGLPDKAIDQNGVLVIPNVRIEDAGNYVCTGSDMISMDKAVATLSVSASQEGPQVFIEPRFQTVKEGDVVQYTCTATGIPVPTIEWRRSSGQMNPEATVINGVMRIPRARKSDESEYYCKGTNVAGTAEVRTILYVQKDESLPEITVIVRQTSIIAVIGTTAQLYCYVEDSNVRPTLVWSRRGGLPQGSSQEGGVLTLTNIQPASSGTYICTAVTPTGDKGTATTEVTVQDARERPEVTIDPQRITVAMGTTGTIRCEVTGLPQPTITWTKSRGELTARHQVNGAVLRIVNAHMEDRGIYVCRAENVAGIAQGWVIVEIERRMKPKVDIVPNPTQIIQIGGSALFQCRVMDGDPPPKITWKRAGDEALDSTVEIMENGVIMFKGVTGAEAGAYICTATNDMGSVSATATLNIQGPPRITIQPSTIIYAVVGQRVTVECIADGEPTPSVYWKYDLSKPRGDIPQTPDFAARATLGSATLTMESVQTTDSGNYVCVANNNVGGDVQKNVQIIVQDQAVDEVGVTISGPKRLTVEEGQAVNLQCNTQGLVNPVVRWRRKNGALPPNHSVRGSNLYIPRFLAEYSGEYICSATAQQRNYETSVFIIVTVRPSLTISPALIEARAGQGIQLSCTPQGSGPFQIEWSKVRGSLSPQARQTSDGVLIINAVTAADAGRYRCLATSASGSSDGYAEVTIQVPPTINAEARESRALVGQRSLSLSCNANGSPPPEIRWSKQGGELPLQHTIRDGVLTIYNVKEEDSGQYVCTASSNIGVARDYILLRTTPRTIDPDTTVRVDTQTVNVGERVEMECVVTGTPRPTVSWSKKGGGALPLSSTVNDVFLVIPEVTGVDAGTYICTAENLVGRVEQRVTLFVRARPLITGSGDSLTAALGTSATLSCEAAGYPAPEITWYRRDGDMPREYDVENGELRIKKVMPEDAGTYMCEARNEMGSNQHAQELRVGDLVPHFTQNPVSYIRYPTMNDAYLDLDVLLSIRPETTDGLVLYNGQYDKGSGDFVCFGLSEGYPEFRFDVGSGPAVIRGENKMDLDKWHTVKLTRDRKQGVMVVDDEPQYTGTSQGRFQGLDLRTDMYLGGVPDYRTLPPEAGFTQGFVGSVSRVALKGVDLNLGAEALEIVGVELFHACQSSPCMNGGKCQISNTAEGFTCLCPHGYTGMRCEVTGQKCHQGACGPDGKCVNLSDRAGFRCICPMGLTGTQCLTAVSIMSPEFNRTSFVSYPPIKGARFQMKIDLQFKPATLNDGIILYSGQSEDGTGDFVSIAVKNGYLEYKYNTGSGPATMTSRRPLSVGAWTRVSVSKNGQEGSLVVNGDDPVQAVSPGNTVGLDLRTKLYLGGVEPEVIIPRSVQVTQGFTGCITQLTVNMQEVDLIKDALESLDVKDCGDRNICNRQPCKNGGACESISLNDYRCTCPEGFRGKNCEVRVNICNTQAPCQNGGACSITNDGYRCDCPLNFNGDNCETAVTYQAAIEVQGDGFVEFSRDKFPHSQTQEEEIVTLKIRATNGNGLLFWHGQATPGQPLQNGDYLSIGLQDGYVKYSYELGSGPVTMRSLRPVFDGDVHTITVTRLGKDGTLAVDGGPKVTGSSRGILQMLNARGNVYVGGVPAVQIMTGGRYTENFQGCILEIHLQDQGPFKVPEDTAGGFNVLPCNS